MAAIEGLCKEAEVVMQRVAPLNDLILKSADGKEFAVSKPLLAAASVMFANMFADLEGGVKTRGAKADGDPLALEEKACEIVLLLNHVYAGSQWKLWPDDIGGSLKLAAKYDMPRLLDACHVYLNNTQPSVSTLPAWLNAAAGYQVPSLTTRCVEFAAGHLQSIIDHRVETKQLPPTAWLERLPKSMLVEIMQLRTRTVGCLATSLDKRNKLLSDVDITQLEKRPRWF